MPISGPPAPYPISNVSSNDASVFTSPDYIRQLNLNGMRGEANQNNALAWSRYQNDWNNYLLNNCRGSAPAIPIWQTVDDSSFNSYWNNLTNNGTGYNSSVVPQAYNLPGGVGVDLVQLQQPSTSTTPVTATPISNTPAPAGNLPSTAVNNSPAPGQSSLPFNMDDLLNTIKTGSTEIAGQTIPYEWIAIAAGCAILYFMVKK